MAIDPIITFTKENDSTVVDDTESTTEFLPDPYHTIGRALAPEDFGSAKAGEQTTVHRIHIWNNKGGTEDANPALGLALTTVNILKENSGGEVFGGKEIVEMKMAGVKNVSGGSEVFTPVGGMTTLSLGDLRGDKLGTPNLPSGTVGHGSGGEVLPGTYYARVSASDETGETLAGAESTGVTVTSLDEQTSEDGSSESLSSTGNTRISYKITASGSYVNGFQLKQSSGGTLVGNLRLETDDNGNPSSTLVSSNSEKQNITLQDDEVTSIFFNNEISWTDGTSYHLVFVVTGGTGTLKGKSTGSDHNVKYYDGSWHDSSSIYDLYCVILGDNLINWSWTGVDNAQSYKLFRTETSASYGASSLISSGITGNTYQDKLCEPVLGEPQTEATVTFGHKKVVDIKIVVNSTAQTADADFYFEARYNK